MWRWGNAPLCIETAPNLEVGSSQAPRALPLASCASPLTSAQAPSRHSTHRESEKSIGKRSETAHRAPPCLRTHRLPPSSAKSANSLLVASGKRGEVQAQGGGSYEEPSAAGVMRGQLRSLNMFERTTWIARECNM